MTKIIEVENLNKVYETAAQRTHVLKDINFSINKGEFVTIMGPSGCGKSTLLYHMGGLEIPTSGIVKMAGKNINKMNDVKKAAIRRNDLGFVFQFYNLVHNLTVKENILLPIVMDGRKERSVDTRLEEILEIVNLTDRVKFLPHELSGGQQQRVAVARALIANPKLILADEPTGNLDSEASDDIMNLFHRINEEKNITIVQVTHSPEASDNARVVNMKDGKIIS